MPRPSKTPKLAENIPARTTPALAMADACGCPPSSLTKERASKLEYVSVKEVWSKTDYAYKIVNPAAVQNADDYDEYLFVVRVRTERSTDQAIKYIDVKSPIIRDALRLILEDVRGISLREDRPSIEQRHLFSFLSEIAAHHKSQSSPDLPEGPAKHLDVLLDYLRVECKSLEEQLQPLLAAKEITFDLLWTLFKPNSDIYTTCPGTGAPWCVRCHIGEEKKRDNGTRYFQVEGHYLDFDGETLGEATAVLSIEDFRGAKNIILLPAYPLSFHPQSDVMRRKLMDCGRRFVSLLDVHHQEYEGKAFYVDQKGYITVVTLKASRIMVDAPYFRKCNPNYRMNKVESAAQNHDVPLLFTMFHDVPTKEASLRDVSESVETLSEQDLLICSPTVRGYSLHLKQWLEFAVALIRNLRWDESCFDRLALPESQKKAVLAVSMVSSRQESDQCSKEFVAGKGRGVIILLHGPPGVGKTLTAETVSEHVQRPLYRISAGYLGTTTDSLEARLSECLDRASHWKAIFLLDEADVFVEQRTRSDIHRNALVAIFLQMLEYHNGTLFLTTNRVKTIDEAMVSRIRLPLKYDNLSKEAREKVWKDQLQRAASQGREMEYTSREFDQLLEKKLNGREITNVVSTAQAMAGLENEVLNLSYIHEAIELYERFQSDFNGAGHFENEKAYV